MATTTLKFYRTLDHEMIDLFLKIMVDQMCYVSLSPSWDITFHVVMRNHAWFEMIRCCRNDGHITNACTDERIRLVLQIECTHMIFKFCPFWNLFPKLIWGTSKMFSQVILRTCTLATALDFPRYLSQTYTGNNMTYQTISWLIVCISSVQ